MMCVSVLFVLLQCYTQNFEKFFFGCSYCCDNEINHSSDLVCACVRLLACLPALVRAYVCEFETSRHIRTQYNYPRPVVLLLRHGKSFGQKRSTKNHLNGKRFSKMEKQIELFIMNFMRRRTQMAFYSSHTFCSRSRNRSDR